MEHFDTLSVFELVEMHKELGPFNVEINKKYLTIIEFINALRSKFTELYPKINSKDISTVMNHVPKVSYIGAAKALHKACNNINNAVIELDNNNFIKKLNGKTDDDDDDDDGNDDGND